MGKIISEGLQYIGSINDDGYIFDSLGNCFAKINESGYIGQVAGGEIYGKIDEDGTIRDASGSVVGRIQADGYVYIHSKRVCTVSSSFVERITPLAWNAGQPSSYSGRVEETKNSDDYDVDGGGGAGRFFLSSFFIKLVIGLAIGIAAAVSGYGGFVSVIAGPILVFIVSFLFKIFFGK